MFIGPDPLTQARAQTGEEARRLRDNAGASATERRLLLADLGTRLGALVAHLTGQGVPLDTVALLRGLAEALRACDGPAVPAPDVIDGLWTRAIAVLDTFAGTTPAPRPGPGPRPPAPPTGQRRTFWKRP